MLRDLAQDAATNTIWAQKMPVGYREIRQYDHFQPGMVKLHEVAKSCQFVLADMSSDSARMRSRLNRWSYGEKIELFLSEINESLVVEISSQCVFPLQIEDWGKNRKNVQQLFTAIEHQLNAVTYITVPVCGHCDYRLIGHQGDHCPECNRNLPRIDGDTNPRTKYHIALRLVVVITIIELSLLYIAREWSIGFGLLNSISFFWCVLGISLINTVTIGTIVYIASRWKPNN